jgi:hypothetical protein
VQLRQPAKLDPKAEARLHDYAMGRWESVQDYANRVLVGTDPATRRKFADRLLELFRQYPRQAWRNPVSDRHG